MTYKPNIVNYTDADFDNWLSKLDKTIFDLYPEYAMFTVSEAYIESLADYIRNPLKGFIDEIEGEYIFESKDSYDNLMNSRFEFQYSKGQGTIDVDYSDTVRGENTDFTNQCKPGSLIGFRDENIFGIVDSIDSENTLKLKYFASRTSLFGKSVPIQKKQKYCIVKEVQLHQYISIAYDFNLQMR